MALSLVSGSSALIELTVLFVILSFPCDAAAIEVDPGESIQVAIDAASPGDTILVKSGTYKGGLNLDKKLILMGEGLPVIDADSSDSAVVISADGCTVEGFSLKNSANMGMLLLSDFNTVADNTVEDGIYLEGSDGNTIAQNQAKNQGALTSGINLNISKDNVIVDNDLQGGWFCGGIYLWRSDNNTLSRNRAESGWLLAPAIGVFASDYNKIIDNNAYGSWFADAIVFGDSGYNLIKDNACIGGWMGDGVHLSNASRYNLVEHNNLTSGYIGVYLDNCIYNSVIGNNVSNNKYGIGLYNAFRNNIEDNNIYHNTDQGIGIVKSSEENNITGNLIRDTDDRGIDIKDSNGNSIYLNRFDNNSINAYSLNSTNVWNSLIPIKYSTGGKIIAGYLGNYWSDYSGKDSGLDGIGDSDYSFDDDIDKFPLTKVPQSYETPDENAPAEGATEENI